MRSAKNIEKFIKNAQVKIDIKAKSTSLGALINELERSRTTTSTPPLINPWRQIMKSKITKFASVTVIVFAFISAIMLMDKSVTPAYALEQSLVAIENVVWMHGVSYSELEDSETISGETWFSVTYGIEAIKHNDGNSEIRYYDKNKSYSYDPATETITLSRISDDNVSRKSNYPDFFDDIIDNINEHNVVEMTTISDVENGEKVKNIEIKVPSKNLLVTEIWRFVIDEKSFLPIRMNLQHYNKAGGDITEVLGIVFDYPHSGPMDIYQLGTPSAAKVIDGRPSMDVQTIIDNYKTAREKDISHYTALVLITNSYDSGFEVAEEAIIHYVDGDKYRREQLTPTSDLIRSQEQGSFDTELEMGNSLGSMLNWWTDREHLSHRYAEMYDGKYMHRRTVQYQDIAMQQGIEEVDSKRRVKNSKTHNLHNMYTGAGDFLDMSSNDTPDDPPITLIENEYSKQNDLICLQRLETGKRFPFVPGGRRYKRLCYIDQNRDYVCTRMEEYFIQDKRWQNEYKDVSRCLVENPDVSLEYTMLLVKEIEYDLTENGKWYPKKIENRTITQCGSGKLQENISTWTIYLETDRSFPEDIFNSDAFSKYLE